MKKIKNIKDNTDLGYRGFNDYKQNIFRIKNLNNDNYNDNDDDVDEE